MSPTCERTDKEVLDSLHDALFGGRSVPQGIRFERLVAVVMAAIGEPFVRHHVVEPGPGRRAPHQIDVWVERGGREQPVIVECKHWASVVGQDVLDRVVGVRGQMDAVEAVVVSVEGFTSGATAVAADEGIRLVRLRPIRDQSNWHGVLREIRMRGRFSAATMLDWSLRAADSSQMPPGGIAVTVDREDPRLAHVDGTAAESMLDLMNRVPSSEQPGEYELEVPLPPGRYVRVDDGTLVAVRALEWRERVEVAHTEHVIGPRSPGLVLIEELNPREKDCPRRRVLMDHQLREWTIGEDRVVRRG